MAQISGDEARRVERLDDEIVKDEVEEILRKVFQDKIKKWGIRIPKDINQNSIFRPTNVHVCKWDSDPRFFGSYSFLPVGCLNEDTNSWNDLIDPVDPNKYTSKANPMQKSGDQKVSPTLFFAGEAYDEKYSGFIQGAYFSGQDIANKIINYFEEL